MSQTAITGSSVTFSVTASGSLLQYQWRKGGAPIPGATSSTLALTNIQSTDAFPYSVTVSNSQGAVTSDSANLVVINNNNPGGSSIFLSPQSRAVPQGTAVSWTVSYQAQRYTWRKNGAAIRDDWQGGYWSGVWPTTTSSYSIPLSLAADAGSYDVVVEVAGTGQKITSTPSTLVVNVADFPAIFTQPAGGYIGSGQPLNLSVYATGSGTLLYQWHKDGVAIPGATSAYYSVNVAETSDAGTYEVLVSNNLGSTDSAQAFVSVLPRPQLLPSTQSVAQGGSVSWSITTTNADRFTWRKNGSPLWTDYQYGGWSGVVGGTTSTYSINPALSTHAGTYDVVVHRVSENVDVVSTPSVLTVQVANEPYIVQQPSSTSSSIGSTVQFSVVATGAETLRYQWKRNGENIPSATSSSLSLSNVQSTDALKYSVVISNTYGAITSSVATLTLESTSPGATLTPSTRSVPEGVQVSWNYSAYNGSVYTWRKNGVTIWQDNKGSGWSGVLGWTSSTYTIPSTQLSDTGDYDVVVQPLSGGSSASSVSALTVVKLIKTALDTDGDGVTDDKETADGTDPNDPNSFVSVNKGLIAYYPFNANAKDESGNGNDGTVNGATLAPDRFGKNNGSYSFAAANGTLQNINLGNLSLFNFGTGDYSIVCWVKLDKDQNGRYILVKYAAVGGSGYGLGTTSGTQAYYFAKGSSDKWIGSGPSLNSGQWRQIAITHKNNVTLSYYLDGQLLQSVSGAIGGSISNNAPLLVGGLNIDGIQQFEGKIDDIRIYNRVLTATEITQLYEDNNLDGVKDSKASSLGYDPTLNLRPLIDFLKKEPVEGMYNQTQYEANRASGRSDVTTSPNTYDLYTTDQIYNMRMGGMVLSRSNNQLILNYEIQQSQDLQSWSTYKNQNLSISNAPTNKMFLRILPKQ